MSSIRKSLVQLLFSGSYMRRWNDKLRPVELYEIDKQAHKMIVAWALILLNSTDHCASERIKLQQEVIEKALFDYLYRLIITDIKPPVFYQICENDNDYAELTDWVLKQLAPTLGCFDPAFQARMTAYHKNRERTGLADRILEAAHLYASGWEYNIIRPLNIYDAESDFIAESFVSRLAARCDVQGVSELRSGEHFFSSPHSALGQFARLSGQLRFQIRWADTPRIPETSVLGHMFLVAALAYCYSLSLGACPARCVNNFFSGLFHDLPELLTRDIITPVKRSVDQLPNLIRTYELQALEHHVFGPLSAAGYTGHVERLRYYLGLCPGASSEFDNTICTVSGVCTLPSLNQMQYEANCDELDPKDGTLLKACDNLAAYLEAYASIRRGVYAPAFYEATARIRGELCRPELALLSLDSLMADFD